MYTNILRVKKSDITDGEVVTHKYTVFIQYKVGESPNLQKVCLHHSSTRHQRAAPWRSYDWVLTGKSQVCYKMESR